MNEFDYVGAANTLAERILALIPTHPEILAMGNPMDLLGIKELQINDLDPSLAQAAWALGRAKLVYAAAAEPT